MIDEKYILDACCGSRMFWFDKEHPNAIYMDNREVDTELCDGRKLEVKPDIVGDFRNMPFNDNSFKLVVFDPPHFQRLGKNSYTSQKYGRLFPTWETDLKSGFDECMRVLEPFGIMIFKWNEYQITVSKIIDIFGKEPLFGHKTGKQQLTHWMAFMKLKSVEG